MGAVASWLLRTSSAHLIIKTAVPSLIVILACATYFTLPDAFGYPVEVAFSSLPQQAELIAFLPHDRDKKVDIWLLKDGQSQPRAYSVELTESLKNTLRQAQQAIAGGQRAMLAKKGKPGKGKEHGQDYIDVDGGNAPYTLLENAFALPKKDGEQ